LGFDASVVTFLGEELMKKILAALAAVSALALGFSTAHAQNVLANPSFEDPTVDTGSANDVWFRFDSDGAGNAQVSAESTVMPRTGSRHIELSMIGSNQFAGVFQNINQVVNPGQKVTFTGWHKAADLPFNATVELKLEWQGSPNPPQNRVDVLTMGGDYEQFMHMGVAPAGTTGLVVTYAISSFGAGQGDARVFIDDFSATIIPEPATVGMMGASFAGLALVRRRRK
jgi:hypothetical protein